MSGLSWDFLRGNIGNRLTPELAQGLMNAIQTHFSAAWKEGYEKAIEAMRKMDGPGLTVQAVPRVIPGGYTFQLANYGKMREQLRPLQEAHFAELEEPRGLKRHFSDEELVAREQLGQLFLFLVLSGFTPVGYMMVGAYKDHTTDTSIATELHFYLHPEHRKGWLSVKFVRWVEEVLQQAGASEFQFTFRATKDLSPILKRLKYDQIGLTYAKVL